VCGWEQPVKLWPLVWDSLPSVLTHGETKFGSLGRHLHNAMHAPKPHTAKSVRCQEMRVLKVTGMVSLVARKCFAAKKSAVGEHASVGQDSRLVGATRRTEEINKPWDRAFALPLY
jgi:hypothetical protein